MKIFKKITSSYLGNVKVGETISEGWWNKMWNDLHDT